MLTSLPSLPSLRCLLRCHRGSFLRPGCSLRSPDDDGGGGGGGWRDHVDGGSSSSSSSFSCRAEVGVPLCPCQPVGHRLVGPTLEVLGPLVPLDVSVPLHAHRAPDPDPDPDPRLDSGPPRRVALLEDAAVATFAAEEVAVRAAVPLDWRLLRRFEAAGALQELEHVLCHFDRPLLCVVFLLFRHFVNFFWACGVLRYDLFVNFFYVWCGSFPILSAGQSLNY